MRHWAILIGINQYQFFQPLSYAQQDAQAVHSFLVNEAGLPPEQCLLLTDISPPISEKSTNPTKENIQSWLDLLAQQQLQPEDVVWFFFSGYGICYQGQDYLVPIESNSASIHTTGILVESIFSRLKRISVETVLVMLDINRFQNSVPTERVGSHTAELADRFGIPTILSCQPEQISRESSILGNGFFTAALLEGLRYRQTFTLASLSQQLTDRVPKLSEYYWRPIQQPLIVSSPDKQTQHILPPLKSASNLENASLSNSTQNSSRNGATAAGNGATIPARAEDSVYLSHPSTRFDQESSAAPISASNAATSAGPITSVVASSHRDLGSDRSTYPTASNSSTQVQLGNGRTHQPPIHNSGAQARSGSASVAAVNLPDSDDTEAIPDGLFWRRLLMWGGVGVAILFIGVLLKNWTSFVHGSQSNPTQSELAKPQPATSAPTKTQLPTNQPSTSAQPVPAASSSAQPQPAAQSTNAANETMAAPAPSVQPAAQPSVNQSPSTPSLPVLTFNPNQRSSTPSGKATTASLLDAARAKTFVKSQQASPFFDAIREASKIPPSDPQYQQAQQEISGWSQDILNIAKQRSNEGFYDLAILAARLVPENQPIYQEAQAAIGRWCPSFKLQPPGNPIQRQKVTDICRQQPGG